MPASATVGASVTGVTIGAPLNGMVTLDPDTATSAYLSFNYTGPRDRLVPNDVTPLDLFGDITEFRYRIDPSGTLLGFQYVRTGLVPGDGETLVLDAQ